MFTSRLHAIAGLRDLVKKDDKHQIGLVEARDFVDEVMALGRESKPGFGAIEPAALRRSKTLDALADLMDKAQRALCDSWLVEINGLTGHDIVGIQHEVRKAQKAVLKAHQAISNLR